MDDPVVHGLSVHAYAAVYAATAEGFPLELVLEHVGIAAADWGEIDEAWAEALADDMDGDGSLGAALESALARAQASYHRPIPPLDDDLAAWIRFFRAWGAAPDPAAFLKARGMEATDVVRLQRRWTAAIERDPALARDASVLWAEENPVAPPMKKPVAVELRLPSRRSTGTMRIQMPAPTPPTAPSLLAAMPPAAGGPLFIPARPVAPAAQGIDDGLATAVETRALVLEEDTAEAQALAPDGADSPAENPFDSVRLGDDFELPPPESVALPSMRQELTLAQYASLRAELEVFPDDEESIFAKYGLASHERRAAVDLAWQERLGTETGTYAEWRQLYRHFSEHWSTLARAGKGA
jgi:hypothetical protein